MDNRMKGQSPYVKQLKILVESRVNRCGEGGGNFKRKNSVDKSMNGWENMGIVQNG